MTEPRTAAGRALDDELVERLGLVPRFTDRILAIEAEARAAALDEARAAVDVRSGASIVFIGYRTLTMDPPGKGVYHLSRAWTYGTVTRCGIVIWSNADQRESKVLPIRRDVASRIARPCRVCGADDD